MEFHLKFLAIFPFGQTAFCFVAAALGQYQVWLPHGVSATRGGGAEEGEGDAARGDNSVSGWATATEFGAAGNWGYFAVEVALWQKL